MDATTLLLLLLAAAGVSFTLWPTLRGTDARWEFSEEDTPLGRLAVRKEVLVGNLADLDFEFAMGKLSEEDYRSVRENLRRQTLRIMEQMDVIASTHAAVEKGAVAADGRARCGSCQGELPPKARFCPQCGTPSHG